LNVNDNVEYWMGHSNFPITTSILDELDNTDGIDILKPISKYRFIIGLGIHFNLTDVRNEIDRNILGKNKNHCELDRICNEKIKGDAYSLLSQLTQEYKHWAIYILPNGNIDYCASNELDESYVKKFEGFNLSKQYSNGVLICSDGKSSY
jgi:hypothetical protein